MKPPAEKATARQDQLRKQKRADPRWSMKASTQLIDDFGGSGIPFRRAEEILTSLLANSRLQFFENHWRFLDKRSGAAVCSLMSTRTLGTTEDAAKEVYGLRANVQAIFFRRRHQTRGPPLTKLPPPS
jgi:hypothetical protein